VFPELVRDGENGFTFQPGDPLSLRRALQEISNPAVSVLAGSVARQDYLSHFTPANNLRALERIYAEAIACNPPSRP
jgi:glycosyltransferase involved in cell wall biosynthesis